MSEDLVLTAEGTSAVVIGPEHYPAMLSIADIKAWAERKGQTFEEVMAEGWKASDLTEEDVVFLLERALVTGERRRQMFGGGTPREITDALVRQILTLAHPAELLLLLVRLWSEPPARKPDPQIPGSSPTGA